MCLNTIVKIGGKSQVICPRDFDRKILFGHLKYNKFTYSFYTARHIPDKKEYIGYKILSKDNSAYFFNEPDGIKYNHVYDSTNIFIPSEMGTYYPSGFHILWYLKDALTYYRQMVTNESMNLYLVSGSRPETYGFDAGNTHVMICKKMIFIKNIGTLRMDSWNNKVIFKTNKDD